jgi:hypothetical protein
MTSKVLQRGAGFYNQEITLASVAVSGSVSDLTGSWTDGTLKLLGSSSGTTTIKAAAVAGTGVITLPTGTDTLAGLGTAQTFTGALTVTGGITVTTNPFVFNQSLLQLRGFTSGITTLQAASVAGNGTIFLPTGSDTLAGLGTVQEWTAAQTFDSTKLILKGSSSGTTALNSAAAAGSGTMTLPTGTDTLAGLATAQTWTGVQSYNSGKLSLNGSSSGATTLNAPSTGGGTLTLPAGSDTLAALGTAQTWTAIQRFNSSPNIQTGTGPSITFTETSVGRVQNLIGSGQTCSTTLPAATGTLACYNITQTWNAVQTYTSSPNIQTSTTPTLNFVETSVGRIQALVGSGQTATTTLPSSTGHLACYDVAQTWSATQTWSAGQTFNGANTYSGTNTFNANKLLLAGSSSGSVTLNAPASGGNVISFPASGVDTVALIGASQTFSGANIYTGTNTYGDGKLLISGATSGSVTLKAPATSGNVLTLPAGIDTIVGRASTDTLTLKTLTSPIITTTTVAGLPAGTTGMIAFATNLRVFNGAGVQEGAAAGTGGHVSYNGSAWKIMGTNVTAVA